MAKNFNTLRDKMSPTARAKSEQLAAKYRAEMALDELREARDMTQQHLATILKVNQAAVSKLEHRTDMYVSTLQHFVHAMGGQLVISAHFPQGEVIITQFENIANGKPVSKAATPVDGRRNQVRRARPKRFAPQSDIPATTTKR